jgi:hypothetical protein
MAGVLMTTFRTGTLLPNGETREQLRIRLGRRKRLPKAKTSTPSTTADELREQGLRSGKVVVTDSAGTVSLEDPAPRNYGRKRRTGKRKKARPVDPFATTPKKDRPATDEQRSELAALSRDPHLNFDRRLAATLTQGQAAQLIPKLRKASKKRSNESRKAKRKTTAR